MVTNSPTTTTPLPSLTPPPAAASGTSTRLIPSKNTKDAILGGIPQTADASGNYTTTYVPPLWVQGVGPVGGVPGPDGQINVGAAGNDHPAGTDWYRAGDEYAPLNTPENVTHLQDQLIQAGLVDPSQIHYGMWTAVDANAYAVVLGQANQYGVSADKMLQWLVGHPNQPVAKLTNSLDVQAMANQVIPRVIGRQLNAKEMAKLTAAWHQVETQNAQALPTQQADGTYSQETGPSFQDFAAQYEKEQNPQAAAQVGMENTFAKLQSAIARI